jgi:hypothetical protein
MNKIRLNNLKLPDGLTAVEAAAIAIEQGASVWPVRMRGTEYEPVPAYAGPGRSPWGLATRSISQFESILRAHPGATVGLRVRTEHGFDRHYALNRNQFVEIAAAIYRVGR